MILCRPRLDYAVKHKSISDTGRFIWKAITIDGNDYTLVDIYVRARKTKRIHV